MGGNMFRRRKVRSPGNQPSQSNSLLSSFATPTWGVVPYSGEGLIPSKGRMEYSPAMYLSNSLSTAEGLAASARTAPRVSEAITCSTPVYVLVFTCGQQGSRNPEASHLARPVRGHWEALFHPHQVRDGSTPCPLGVRAGQRR